MGRVVRVAAAQMGPASYDKAENLARIAALLQDAQRERVELISFPELATTTYLPAAGVDPSALPSLADEAPYDGLASSVRAASEASMALVLPFVRKEGAAYFNSALVADASGAVLGAYDKVHIPFGERPYFQSGRAGFPVFPTRAGLLGALICADRGFPEAWRVLALEGAEIVASPYNTSMQVPHNARSSRPAIEVQREQQALRMRGSANMNGFFVVAAGKGGVEAGTQYIGRSMVISPWGDVLACASGDGDELVVADADLDLVRDAREGLAFERKRHPEAYGLLIQAPVPA